MQKIVQIIVLASTVAGASLLSGLPAYAYKVGDCLDGDRYSKAHTWIKDSTCKGIAKPRPVGEKGVPRAQDDASTRLPSTKK